jgi:hypothetical protein
MQEIFVCDLVVAIKYCKGDFYNMYYDQTSKFTTNQLLGFQVFVWLQT